MKKNLLILILSLFCLSASPVSANTSLIDSTMLPHLKESQVKQSPSDPQFRMYMVMDFSSTFSNYFFVNTWPSLQQEYKDTVEFVFVHASLDFFDKETARQEAKLSACLSSQNIFWESLPLIAQQGSSVIPLTYFDSPNREKLETCMAAFSEAEVETLYQKALNAANNGESIGIPYFLIEDYNRPQKLDFLINGSVPFSDFQAAFDQVATDYSRDEIRVLLSEKKELEQELGRYKSLTFWQKLKLLFTSENTL